MKNKSKYTVIALVAVGVSVAAAEKWDISKVDLSKLPAAAKKEGLTYDKDIRPMLEESCFRCHGPDQQKGGLRLDSLDAMRKGGEGGKVLVAGKGHQSVVVVAASQIDDDLAMPPKRRPGGPPGPGGPGRRGGAGRPEGGRPEGTGDRPPGGPGGKAGQGGPGGPGGPGGGGFGPPPKPLTPDQVALLRAWVDQGAK